MRGVVLGLHGHLRLGPGVEHDHGAALAPAIGPAHDLAAPQLSILAKQVLHVCGGHLERQLAREHLGLCAREREEEEGELVSMSSNSNWPARTMSMVKLIHPLTSGHTGGFSALKAAILRRSCVFAATY